MPAPGEARERDRGANRATGYDALSFQEIAVSRFDGGDSKTAGHVRSWRHARAATSGNPESLHPVGASQCPIIASLPGGFRKNLHHR